MLKKLKVSTIYLIFLFLISNLYSKEKIGIAVADFRRINVSEMDAAAISDLLRTELTDIGLASTGKYIVVSRSKMQQILAEKKLQMAGCSSQECAVKIGKLLNVRGVVIGKVIKIGKRYIVNADMVDVITGQIVKSGMVKSDSIEELTDKAEDLASQIYVQQDQFKTIKKAVPVKPKKKKVVKKPEPEKAEKEKPKKTERKARTYAFLPGIIFHGSGHLYAKDSLGALELFAVELFSLHCLTKAQNVDLPEKLSFLENIEGHEDAWYGAWTLAGGVLFFTTWLYDFIDAPKIVEARGFLDHGEKSHFLKMTKKRRFRYAKVAIGWSLLFSYYGLTTEALMLGSIGIIYVFDRLFWQERFYVTPEEEQVLSINTTLSMSKYPMLNLTLRF